MKIKENKLEELEKMGFKKDNRKNVLYSITDELFGEIAVVWEDRKISFYEFSDGIRFKLMTENFFEKVEG